MDVAYLAIYRDEWSTFGHDLRPYLGQVSIREDFG